MEKHLKIKKIFKTFGILVASVGAILMIIGFVDFFTSFGSFESPKLFWCAFLGMFLLGIGMVMLVNGFRSEIQRYAKNELVPIINETSEELSGAVGNIASSINTGINNKIKCSCGELNEEEDRYCIKCGKPLYITCPKCGEEASNKNLFCGKCGTKLRN